MRELVLVIAVICTSVVAAGTAYQFYIFLWRPQLTKVPRPVFSRWPTWRRAWTWVSIGAVCIGMGYMTYKGVEGALWFVPKSWRHIGDDGDSEWIGHGVALMVSIFGSALFLNKLNELASEKAREFWNRRDREI